MLEKQDSNWRILDGKQGKEFDGDIQFLISIKYEEFLKIMDREKKKAHRVEIGKHKCINFNTMIVYDINNPTDS